MKAFIESILTGWISHGILYSEIFRPLLIYDIFQVLEISKIANF